MVLEKTIIPFWTWLLPSPDGKGALFLFLLILGGLLAVSLFVAYLRMVLLLGPGEAFYAVAKAVADAFPKELPRPTSRAQIAALGRLAARKFQRLWAITWLAMQESLRRWVLVVFAVFVLALLAAGWFLDVRSDHPARVYLSFVLTATEFLLLPVAVVLSAFSLPGDIKSKTIHTVVTKPVRAGEIVLGRILGFCLINTALLVLTCLVSYVFVVRGLSHRHTLVADDLEEIKAEGASPGGWKGSTSLESFHRHEVTLAADGTGQTDTKRDHYHQITARPRDGKDRVPGRPARRRGWSRIPHYGKLEFVSRENKPDQGISVGKEWTYRRFIEGASQAAGIWTFDGITPERYPDGLPLEMTLSVFRTHKGDIVSGILGTITLRNPRTPTESEPLPFTAAEYVTESEHIPRKLKAVDQGRRAPRHRPVPAGRRRAAEAGGPLLRAGPVLRHGPTRRVSPRPRCAVLLELPEGLCRDLAADGDPHLLRRGVQHLPQRPGGHVRRAGDLRGGTGAAVCHRRGHRRAGRGRPARSLSCGS